MLSYSPPRVDGDPVPGRPGSRVTADATLQYSSNKLEATVCMSVADAGNGSAAFGGCSVEFLHTTDPDWIIEAILSETASQVSYRRGRQTRDVREGTRRGLVRQWTLGDFTQTGSLSDVSVSARLNDILLVTAADTACVSPMAYLEARRTGAIDGATRRSVDRQLETIDPAVVKLRPRFVLPD